MFRAPPLRPHVSRAARSSRSVAIDCARSGPSKRSLKRCVKWGSKQQVGASQTSRHIATRSGS
eukprot:13580363-Alexandrium_andersonii.AAC.1